MTIFLWTALVLNVLNAVGHLIWLAKGEVPERTTASTALQVAADCAFAMWAAVLLVKG